MAPLWLYSSISIVTGTLPYHGRCDRQVTYGCSVILQPSRNWIWPADVPHLRLPIYKVSRRAAAYQVYRLTYPSLYPWAHERNYLLKQHAQQYAYLCLREITILMFLSLDSIFSVRHILLIVPSSRLHDTTTMLVVWPSSILVCHVPSSGKYLIHCFKIYDYLLTFGREASLVWRSPWSIVKILFLLARYTPFVSISAILSCASLHTRCCI